jgi:hypothetical protein
LPNAAVSRDIFARQVQLIVVAVSSKNAELSAELSREADRYLLSAGLHDPFAPSSAIKYFTTLAAPPRIRATATVIAPIG